MGPGDNFLGLGWVSGKTTAKNDGCHRYIYIYQVCFHSQLVSKWSLARSYMSNSVLSSTFRFLTAGDSYSTITPTFAKYFTLGLLTRRSAQLYTSSLQRTFSSPHIWPDLAGSEKIMHCKGDGLWYQIISQSNCNILQSDWEQSNSADVRHWDTWFASIALCEMAESI